MTIGKKLLTGCSVLTAICLLVGGIAIRNVGNMGDSMEALGHHYVHSLYLTGDINYLTADMVSTNRGILIRGMNKDPEKAKRYNDHFAEDMDRLKHEAGEFVQGTRRPELHDLGQNEILDKLDALNQANSAMYDLIAKGDLAEATKVQGERVLPLARGISEAGDKLAQLEGKVVTAKADEAIATVSPAKIISGLMIALSLAVGAIIVFIVRGITADLTASIAELRDGADQVSGAASQVSSSSQSLAQGASEQAASLEETSASSEEINSMARRNTDNSRSTAELLAQSQAKVMSANQHLAEMVVSMNEITNSSGKISKIIKVIDEIAFQTNILALNAAVEAARAGEAGMGFAVVADEVRSLAQRSAQAAKDTTSLIEESIAKSGEGQSKVDQVAKAIKAVTEDSARIKVMVDEVSLGSEEQSRGVDQITRAIGQMEQVTQTTAASAEECAAAAEELSAQSQTMNDVVGRLYAMVDVGASQTGLSSRSRVAISPRRAKPSHLASAPHANSSRKSSSRSQAAVAFGLPNRPGSGASTHDEFPMEVSV